MTGQPNAMGGREVGGLANMLAAHLDVDNPAHQQLVKDFWQSPAIAQEAGLKAVDMFRAVESGQIKAIWIMATNPVVSLPDADQVKRALEQCEFVVVSDICASTDTTAYADVLLPALGWGEKDGTVTNSERRITRQRGFLPAPGEAKPDWWAIAQVAQAMNFSGFEFDSAFSVFQEHVALSSHGNAPIAERHQAAHFRYFNLAGLSDLTAQQYHDLQPLQWPYWQANQDPASVERFFANGQFSHANGKAKLLATPAIDPIHAVSDDYPIILNTGRVRDQWHTMTRTGLSANLASHRAEPYCEIHPQDALKFGLKDASLVEVSSRWGKCVLRVQYSEGIRRGQVFAPIHWNEQVASDARIGKVVNPEVDAISGEPEFKHTPVMLQPFYTRWQGVLYVRDGFASQVQPALDACAWWCKIKTSKAMRFELADRLAFSALNAQISQWLPFHEGNFEWLNLHDASANISHTVILQDAIVVASLYIAPPELLPDRDWVAGLFKRERLSAMHRKALLAGMPMSQKSNDGPLVCSCFKVGKNKIIETIKAQNISHEKQVTACLKAGGNCGSCLPEIRGLIKACQTEATT